MSIKENEVGLIENIDPLSYIDYFLGKLIKYKSIEEMEEDENLLSLDRLILEEYQSRFEEDEVINLKKIFKIINSEKSLINLCIGLVIKRRVELANYKVEKLNFNLGMIYALSDANNIKKKDILYAAANEKFVHGTSTSFGILRENEAKKIEKKESNHVFSITTKEVDLKDKSSFDIVLLVIEDGLVSELTFIQMSSGPNCKNFTHAIQLNNVRNWFNNVCESSLQKLKDFILKGEREEYSLLIDNLNDNHVGSEKIKAIVGQAYGDEGMTTSMMKVADVDVVRGNDLWELITGVEGVNPFKAEMIAGIIVMNINKIKEPRETQKMSFWEMIDYKMSLMEPDLDVDDFSID